ncbi:MAG: pentapeptide repeat-containing protein, partial [Dehalococcoidales bacterium]|nr:pentapeptide repeat-containing protein [Dehalococcoidales bacterium]
MPEFTKDNYYQEKFSGLSLTEETVTGIVFEECSFDSCSFITCTFERLRFVNCKLTDCILSAVVPMNCRFDDVSFTNCKVIGIDWTRTT